MLEFKQDDTAATLILTLTELVSIDPVNYLFVFTHVLTKDTVAFVELGADEESLFTSRYNQFTIDPSVLFAGKDPGEWHYKVYQQTSDVNIDPEQSGALIEEGKMILDRAVDYAPNMYDEVTSFKAYNG